jgi:hypothetical protein
MQDLLADNNTSDRLQLLCAVIDKVRRGPCDASLLDDVPLQTERWSSAWPFCKYAITPLDRDRITDLFCSRMLLPMIYRYTSQETNCQTSDCLIVAFCNVAVTTTTITWMRSLPTWYLYYCSNQLASRGLKAIGGMKKSTNNEVHASMRIVGISRLIR